MNKKKQNKVGSWRTDVMQWHCAFIEYFIHFKGLHHTTTRYKKL